RVLLNRPRERSNPFIKSANRKIIADCRLPTADCFLNGPFSAVEDNSNGQCHRKKHRPQAEASEVGYWQIREGGLIRKRERKSSQPIVGTVAPIITVDIVIPSVTVDVIIYTDRKSTR